MSVRSFMTSQVRNVGARCNVPLRVLIAAFFALTALPLSAKDLSVELWSDARPTEVRISSNASFELRCKGEKAGQAAAVTLSHEARGQTYTDEDAVRITGLGEGKDRACLGVSVVPSATLTVAMGSKEKAVTAEITGVLEVGTSRKGLELTSRMPQEEYVARAVAVAAADYSQPELLKAIAIVARSWPAYWQMEGMDGALCDSEQCNPIWRESTIPSAATEAAEATAGKVLLKEDGEIIKPMHHPMCGERTLAIADVFDFQADYLQSVETTPDMRAFCERQPGYRWERELTKDDVVTGMRPDIFWEGTAIPKLVVEGQKIRLHDASIRTQNFRRRLAIKKGESVLASNTFTIEDKFDLALFKGVGRGHGVGLCQCAGASMAQSGKSVGEILTFFFPGTKVGPMPNITNKIDPVHQGVR